MSTEAVKPEPEIKTVKTKVRISTISDDVPRWSMSNLRKVGPAEHPVDKKSWIAKYHYFVYTAFALDLIGVIAYLCVIATQMHNPVMYLEYSRVTDWLNLNSYSMLSPFWSLPLLFFLTLHVRRQKKVVDGDFFGLQGFFLILVAVLLHDSWKLAEGRDFIIALIPKPLNEEEHCNRLKDLQSLYDAFNKEIRVLRFRTPVPNPTVNYTEIPTWLQEFQRDHDCCGVNPEAGVDDWVQFQGLKNFSEVPWSCCCKKSAACQSTISCDISNNQIAKDKRGCAVPVWHMMVGIYELTYICMLTLAALHCLSIIAYTVHWIAMKKLIPEDETMDKNTPIIPGTRGRKFSRSFTHSRYTLRRATLLPAEPTTPRTASDTSVSPHVKVTRSLADLDPNVEEMAENEESIFAKLFGKKPKKNMPPSHILP